VILFGCPSCIRGREDCETMTIAVTFKLFKLADGMYSPPAALAQNSTRLASHCL
jgi:hypothetical protein